MAESLKLLVQQYEYECQNGRKLKCRRLGEREIQRFAGDGGHFQATLFNLFKLTSEAPTISRVTLVYEDACTVADLLCEFADAQFVRENFELLPYRGDLVGFLLLVLRTEGVIAEEGAEGALPADPSEVDQMSTEQAEALGNSSEPTDQRKTTTRSGRRAGGSSTTAPETSEDQTAA